MGYSYSSLTFVLPCDNSDVQQTPIRGIKCFEVDMRLVAPWPAIACCALGLAIAGCNDANTSAKSEKLMNETAAQVAVIETRIQPLALEDDSVQTRYGKLEIVRSQPDMPPDTLNLDGKQILRQEAFYLSLHHYVTQNERDVVVVGSNCGGTGCPENQFYLVVLDKEAPSLVLTQDNFVAYPDDLKVKADGKDLVIDLGFDTGKHKFATLQDKTLKITLNEAPKTFLGEEDCQWLHKDALAGCLEYRDSNTKCTDPQSEFSGYLARGVAALANYPGFGHEAFKKYCFTTCDTSKRPDYATFAKEVCSK